MEFLRKVYKIWIIAQLVVERHNLESHCKPRGKRKKSTNLSIFKVFMTLNFFKIKILGFLLYFCCYVNCIYEQHFDVLVGKLYMNYSWESRPKLTSKGVKILLLDILLALAGDNCDKKNRRKIFCLSKLLIV